MRDQYTGTSYITLNIDFLQLVMDLTDSRYRMGFLFLMNAPFCSCTPKQPVLLRKPLQRVVVTRPGKLPGTAWFTNISLKKI